MLSWKSSYLDDKDPPVRRTVTTAPEPGETEEHLYDRHFKDLWEKMELFPKPAGNAITSERV